MLIKMQRPLEGWGSSEGSILCCSHTSLPNAPPFTEAEPGSWDSNHWRPQKGSSSTRARTQALSPNPRLFPHFRESSKSLVNDFTSRIGPEQGTFRQGHLPGCGGALPREHSVSGTLCPDNDLYELWLVPHPETGEFACPSVWERKCQRASSPCWNQQARS